jgi:hypothetical protein
MLSKACTLKLLTRGASRALSSNAGAGGVSDRERGKALCVSVYCSSKTDFTSVNSKIDSMVEYMRNIAQKREAAGGKEASGTLWSK